MTKHSLIQCGLNYYERVIRVYLDPKLKTNYVKVFGIILILLGGFNLLDGINALLDPNISVTLNGMERNDFEAKLTLLFLPIVSLIAGIIMTQIRTGTIENQHTAQRKFWSIFK